MEEHRKHLFEKVSYIEFEKYLQKKEENDKKIKYQKYLFENVNDVRYLVGSMEDIELRDILLDLILGIHQNNNKCFTEKCNLKYEIKELKEKLAGTPPLTPVR
jgi:hypothetical protein